MQEWSPAGVSEVGIGAVSGCKVYRVFWQGMEDEKKLDTWASFKYLRSTYGCTRAGLEVFAFGYRRGGVKATMAKKKVAGL